MEACLPALSVAEKRKRFTKVSAPREIDLEAYWKKSKVTTKFDFHITCVHPPVSYTEALVTNMLWMMAANLFAITPMWT